MTTGKNINQKKITFAIFLKVLLAIFLFLLLVSLIKTCVDCNAQRNRVITIIDQTGYLPDNENWDDIPDVVPPYDDDDLDSLPEAVSLENFFPPIGDQGNFGTCVAWAVGYNLKTALNAIENHWTSSQLADPANQTSPKDLWMGIPTASKGNYCQGTIFEPAFSVLVTQGASNMKDVPYKNLGSCKGKIVGDTTNKITNFNHVVSNDGLPSVGQIKAYLNDTVPLVISARLGDNFMKWNSDRVLTSDNYLQPGMDHAYHAMVLVGYDDALHAFRVRNSWGTQWGDEGSIWVDYDFFIHDFCSEVFMANN